MQLFMAVTSTGSAEVIAVSSVLTYDLYWTYLNPELREKVKEGKVLMDKALAAAGLASAEPGAVVTDSQVETLVKSLIDSGWTRKDVTADTASKAATAGGSKLFEVKAACIDQLSSSSTYEGKILVRMSRFYTCVFAIFMGFLAVLLNQLGLGLGWVYQAMGNIIGSAVCPVALAILYEKANGTWCTIAAVVGFLLAIFSWILKTSIDFDEAAGGVTIDNMGALYPNLVGNLVAILSSGFIALVGSLAFPDNEFKWEKLNEIDVVDDVIPELKEGEDEASLKKDATRANWQAIVLTLILVVAWPIPQHISGGVFTKGGFGVWIGVAFIWAMLGALVIIIMPPVEFLMKKKPDDSKTQP
jgi:Na+/proline symporter